jgi:hypothetical protein
VTDVTRDLPEIFSKDEPDVEEQDAPDSLLGAREGIKVVIFAETLRGERERNSRITMRNKGGSRNGAGGGRVTYSASGSLNFGTMSKIKPFPPGIFFV